MFLVWKIKETQHIQSKKDNLGWIVWANTIFGLKMMVKSGLEKVFLKFLHAGDYFPLLHKNAQIHKFSNSFMEGFQNKFF